SIIFCGDVNTSHKEIDIARPKENRKHTGFLLEECAWMDKLIDQHGYIDIFRHLNPDRRDCYSWWASLGGARARNIGWRLDYFFISPDLLPRVAAAEIHADVLGSDHCPVSLTLV
ncbi:MAG: exodeoxyribonuclease III, partial [Nitrospiraceae bacterium]|nr:exodeoxyribonuclease III [Nitrospiraceae bacterium]